MERLKYLGTDPRLEQGTVYDCTVARHGTETNVSAHVSFHVRVYKYYRSIQEFERDWVEER